MYSQSGYIHNVVASGAPSSASNQQWGPGSQSGWHYPGWVQGNGVPSDNAQDQNSVIGYAPSCRRGPHTVMAFGFGGTFLVVRPDEYNGQRSVTRVFDMNSLLPSDPCLEFNRLENKSKDDIRRWIEERAMNCSYEEADDRDRQTVPLIWRVLKIAQEYGKLRDGEGGRPNAEVGLLILSHSTCQNLRQHEIVGRLRSFLMCGRAQNAITECQSYQLSCGLVLLLAAEMRNKVYVDTVTLLAQQFWSFLQSFCEDRSGEDIIVQCWPEYLALAATGRTVHRDFVNKLGDLLRTRGLLAGAELCSLLAYDKWENFFLGKIRLLGADHEMFPRTYATPSAIKRTELYEHAKAKESAENIPTCFQPYKLVYANMLAEIGLKEDALSYSQEILKLTEGSLCNPELQRQAADLQDRLAKSLEIGKSTGFAGRVLSNTFNYVKSSLPASRITGYNSPSPSPTDSEATSAFTPAHTVWEPDLNMYQNEDATSSPAPGLLRRVSSNVVETTASVVGKTASMTAGVFGKTASMTAGVVGKTASLIGRNRQTEQGTHFDREYQGMTEDYSYQSSGIQIPPQLYNNEYYVAPSKPAGYYTQYATWCKDGGSRLVRSIPAFPQRWNFLARKDETARCDV